MTYVAYKVELTLYHAGSNPHAANSYPDPILSRSGPRKCRLNETTAEGKDMLHLAGKKRRLHYHVKSLLRTSVVAFGFYLHALPERHQQLPPIHDHPEVWSYTAPLVWYVKWAVKTLYLRLISSLSTANTSRMRKGNVALWST